MIFPLRTIKEIIVNFHETFKGCSHGLLRDIFLFLKKYLKIFWDIKDKFEGPSELLSWTFENIS